MVGYTPELAYAVAACHYQLRDYAAALKVRRGAARWANKWQGMAGWHANNAQGEEGGYKAAPLCTEPLARNTREA